MVSASHEGALGLGARVVTVRRFGKREQTVTMEMTGYDAPNGWSLRGVDGPVRPMVETRIEPVDDGARSRVTIELDFTGHGVGKVLVPLLVRPEARKGLHGISNYCAGASRPSESRAPMTQVARSPPSRGQEGRGFSPHASGRLSAGRFESACGLLGELSVQVAHDSTQQT